MKTAPSRIAIVSDCDDTLAPDTTAQLLKRLGVDPGPFYKDLAGRLVDGGWDPPLAYLHEMLRLTQNGGPLQGLTRDAIKEAGASLEFYPGVPKIFYTLEQEVKETYGEYGIKLEEYVITGGIADLIAASPLGSVVDEIWGCNFAYDEKGRLYGIKNTVSFTEKTRFLFNIEKGLVGPGVRNKPYDVNQMMEPEERPIPLRNMIYMGDGPSDIPCMSIIQKAKGYVIGILSSHDPNRTWALSYGRRAHLTVPPDFREGQHGYMHLRQAVLQFAERIKGDLEFYRRSGGPTPTY